MELKKHATPVELVPDSETFRFGPGAVKKSSRAAIFPVDVGQNVFLLRASLLKEEVSFMLSGEALGSVIDVAEKTIDFRNFQNDKVPLEIVAGHLTSDLKPKQASALQKTVDTSDVRTGTSGVRRSHFFDRLQKKMVWIHHPSHIMLPRPPHRQKTLLTTRLTPVHGQTDVSSCDFQA